MNMQDEHARKKHLGQELVPGPDSFLEPEDQGELNQAWVAYGRGYLPEAVTRGDTGTRRGTVECLPRNAELWMVEQVEELCPELNAHFLGNGSSLEDGKVKVLCSITAKG